MASLNKTNASRAQPYSGAFGNQSVAIFDYTAAAAAIGDVIYLGKLPRYAKVYNVTLINAALGAATTLALGYETAEIGGTLATSAAYYLPATATSSAAKTPSPAAAVPLQLPEETYVIATVAGGAATGTFYVIVEYRYENK